jgi:hypothetical protein
MEADPEQQQFPQLQVADLRSCQLLFSKRSVAELSNCGKLLKARRGEVAERLNAAVC